MALEILVPNSAIRNLIREDKIHQIYSMMQTGQDKFGMQTFNQALATLVHKKQITLDVAMQRSSNADELKELIEGVGRAASESGVAVTLLVLAILFGVMPSIMLDVMNPSTVALTKSLSEGYSNSAGAQPAAVPAPQVSLTK